MTVRTLLTQPQCSMDDTLPTSVRDLVGQIKTFAALRRKEALQHPKRCTCTACYVRKHDEARPCTHRRAA